jgi:Ca-activated chloride channel family protein
MTFLWPEALLSLLLIPVGVIAWRLIDRGRRARAAAGGGLGLTRPTRTPGRIRGRLPAALFLLGFVLLGLGLARPHAVLALPRQAGTVILCFDVSASMAADDLEPTRMEAAKQTARDFIAKEPVGVVIGIVAFTDSGLSVQVPTADQTALNDALDRLTPQHGTAIGQGITAALSAIDIAEHGPSNDYYTNRSPEPTTAPEPVPPGSHSSAVIVLLTDGENNEQPDPLAVSLDAAVRGIKIDTVGLGSPDGATIDLGGYKIHTQLNEVLLKQIANLTAGSYTNAQSVADLQQVYADLGSQLVMTGQSVEVTALFAGLALAVLVLATITSYAWLGRLP